MSALHAPQKNCWPPAYDPIAVTNHLRRLNLDSSHEAANRVMDRMTEMRDQGYALEYAWGTTQLAVYRAAGTLAHLFNVSRFSVGTETRFDADGAAQVLSTAVVQGRAGDAEFHEAEECQGFAEALHSAFAKAARRHFGLNEVEGLVAYHVHTQRQARGGGYTRVTLAVGDVVTQGVATCQVSAAVMALKDAFDVTVHRQRGDFTAKPQVTYEMPPICPKCRVRMPK